MDAREYLNVALGGNMNFGTLKPLAIEEIMGQYAYHKMKESPTVDTSGLFAGYVRVDDLQRVMKVFEQESDKVDDFGQSFEVGFASGMEFALDELRKILPQST